MIKKTVILMSRNGEIKKIVVDELLIVNNNSDFIELIDSSSYKKYFEVLNLIDKDKDIKNIGLEFIKNNLKKEYYINGIRIKTEGLILIISENAINDNKVIEDIMKINNIQTNRIRSIVKKQIQSNREENDVKDFDDISKINNELINTKRKLFKVNKELVNVNIKFKSIIENIHEIIVLVDLEGNIILSNSGFKNISNNNNNLYEFIKENSIELFVNMKNELSSYDKGKDLILFEDINLKSDSNIYYDIKIVPIFDEKDKKLFYTFTFDDVTQRKVNLRNLKYLKKAFDQSKESIAITSINGSIIFANKSFINQYKYEKEEIVSEDINDFTRKVSNDDKNNILDIEVLYNKTKTGEIFPVEISKTEVYDNSRVISYIYIIKNISKRIEYEEKLIILATRDKMTGTYSREAGITYLKNLINDKKEDNNITILFSDINGLKYVNDKYGHASGDQLINEVTSVLRGSIRDDDIVARLGGDEFLTILPKSGKENGLVVTERILNEIEKKNDSNKYNFDISVSIGIASYDEKDFESIDQFINLADKRMYEEKNDYYNNKEDKDKTARRY